MKALFRKMWFRRSCQISVVLISLIFLLVAALNWFGARTKREIVDRMRAEGRPTSIVEMLEPLPPDVENFAMIPVLVEARDRYWFANSAGDVGKSDPAAAKLMALGAPSLAGDRGFGDGKNPDLSHWKEALQLAGNDAECLSAYDLQHGDVLTQLRAGLSRAKAVSPLLRRMAAEDEIAGYRFGFPGCLLDLARGLRFRAELALAAQQAEIGLESLLIYLRLAEMIPSDAGLIMGQAYQNTLIYAIHPTLARALASGNWSRDQIESLKSALANLNALRGNLRDLDCYNVWTLGRYQRIKDHPAERRNVWMLNDRLKHYPRPMWVRNGLAKVDSILTMALPDGWFDFNAALDVKDGLDLRQALGAGDHFRAWIAACEAAEARAAAGSTWDLFRFPREVGCRWPPILKHEIHAQTLLLLARLACDLECDRLDRGRYPERLDELKHSDILDQLSGEPFRYRRPEAGYLLYSVGADGKDSGGKRNDRPQVGADDWVW